MASWFLKPSGRRVMKTLAYSGVTGGFLIYYLPNALYTEQYKQITQLYKNGIAVKVPASIPTLVEAAMNDLQMSQEKKDNISIYTGYGFDMFRSGIAGHSSKCVLGIPSNFQYSNVEEFEETGIVVNNEPVPWGTPEGTSLKESLILSDDAKKFALARELVHLDTAEPLLNGAIASAVLFMCYTLGSNMNSRFNLQARARGVRLVLYILTSTFGYANWILLKDMTCVSYEEKADKSVAKISEKYARGGLEFYEKILQRNIALRSIMKDQGESLFTTFGNDQVLLRTKHLPFTTRRNYMKARVEEYSTSAEESPKEQT